MGHLVGQLEDSFETYGMDVNYWAVKQSKSVVKESALQTASAQELPYKDGSFNVVIIKHIVEHLPDPEKAIAEIGRVTEKGGTLILATPNLDSLLKPWKGKRWIGYQDPTHISLKTPAEWFSYIQNRRLYDQARICRWLLGCALYSHRPKTDPKTDLWLAWWIAGHHGFCLPACEVG